MNPLSHSFSLPYTLPYFQYFLNPNNQFSSMPYQQRNFSQIEHHSSVVNHQQYKNEHPQENQKKEQMPKTQSNSLTKKIKIDKQLNQQESEFNLKKKYKRSSVPKQNQSRNCNSNILRYFIKYLSEEDQAKYLILRIIQKQKLNITWQKFNMQMQSKQINYKNYIRPKSIKKILHFNYINTQFSKILRIMFKHFIKNIYGIYLINSAKNSIKSWIMHLGASRLIIDQMIKQIP